MLILLSPAKTLDFDTPIPSFVHSVQAPMLLEESEQLIGILKTYDEAKLSDLMGLSAKLSTLNVSRYQTWTGIGSRPAIYAFKGDVYQGLDAHSMSAEVTEKAESSLLILSGLYGTVTPLTAIEAHRLEMGTGLKTKRGKNLYEFWGTRVTEEINKKLTQQTEPVLVNLASQEYSRVIQWKDLTTQVITPVFKDEKNGKYKVISFYAKRARGLLARHLLESDMAEQNTQRALVAFTSGGYVYDPTSSTPKAPLFMRSEASRLHHSN